MPLYEPCVVCKTAGLPGVRVHIPISTGDGWMRLGVSRAHCVDCGERIGLLSVSEAAQIRRLAAMAERVKKAML